MTTPATAARRGEQRTAPVQEIVSPPATPTIPAPTPTASLVRLDPKVQALRQVAIEIDGKAALYRSELENVKGTFERAIVMGAAVNSLRAALTPDVMQLILPLMNQEHGFLTDRGPHAYREEHKVPYAPEVVKEVLITATILGFLPTGNEFNIIAHRFFGAKAGYYRKVREFPGVTDVRVISGQPRLVDGQTNCRVAVVLQLDGVHKQLLDHEGRPGMNFVVPVNKGMGTDGVQGKAERRALKRMWEFLLGRPSGIADDEISEPAGPERQLAAGATGGQRTEALLEARKDRRADQALVEQITTVARSLGVDEDGMAAVCADVGASLDAEWSQGHAEQILAALEARRGQE